MRKFVDHAAGPWLLPIANTLGISTSRLPLRILQHIPGSDYYQIGLVEYTQKMHSDLPATKLRGYKDLAPGA